MPEVAGQRTEYPDIPRIDAHSHGGIEVDKLARFLNLRGLLLERYGVDLAIWINLGDDEGPQALEERVASAQDLRALEASVEDRMLWALDDYSPHCGPGHAPDELQEWLDRGCIGYKIWYGPAHRVLKDDQEGHPYVDDPVHDPTFAKMEEIGMVGASIHIGDPNGPYGNRHQWLPDPVEFWRIVTAWRHVLERHPDLQVVTAHMCWLCCQDAQLDYLRNMLATFPGMYIDLAATFYYYHLVNRDNLRDFMIEFADRILYGTDLGNWSEEEKTSEHVDSYFQTFQILETDAVLPGAGFWGEEPTEGLALPAEVLEKIYYRNAARIYPRVREQLQKLGYTV